jgi:hypothetical protein
MNGQQVGPIENSRSVLVSWLLAAIASLCVGMLGCRVAEAKPPTLTSLFPAGAGRGQTVEVTASGTFDHWPPQVWVDRGGITVKCLKEKGKLSVSAAPDAEPGVALLRIYDEDGATALRPFVLGVVAERLEVEPNDDPVSPQRVDALPVTINGRLAKNGDVDGYSVALEQGQQLVGDLVAQRQIGSPMDGVMQIVSERGFVLTQNDDTSESDPRLVFTAPAKGRYTVRLFAFPTKPDSSIRFSGGPGFIYRLTLTTSGFVDYLYPLAVGRESATVETRGWNIAEPGRWLTLPAQKEGQINQHLYAGVAEVRRVSMATAVDTEPNDLARPQQVANAVAISGRIDANGDQDVYQFQFKKGDKRVFRVESRSLGFPLDPLLQLVDSTGKVVFDVDDTTRTTRDVERAVTIETDGNYRAIVRDMNDRGGSRFAYLLTVQAPLPDYSLTLEADRFDVTPGKPTSITVTVVRKEGFAGAIEVEAVGLPEGSSAKVVVSKGGSSSSRSVKLEITASECACSGPFRVVGREAGKSKAEAHQATAPVGDIAIRTESFWLTVNQGGSKPAKEP